jgi:iron complex transport system permease protein
MTIILVITGIVSLSIGPAKIPSDKEIYRIIIFSLRLPRILLALLVGSGLSLAGVVFQTILRNPLADPYILGISSGSALGAISAIILSLFPLMFWIPVHAFIFGLLTIILVYLISRGRETNVILLSGVIINSFFSAIIMFLVSISGNKNLQGFTGAIYWLMGNLSSPEYNVIIIISVVLSLGGIVIYSNAKNLNLILMGEDTAMQMGVEVEKIKKLMLFTGSLITAVVVAFSGIIGFVGLIVPHISRLIFGNDHRILIISSAFIGGIFLIFADTIARTILSPSEIPVGVVTAMTGAPFFLYLLIKRR